MQGYSTPSLLYDEGFFGRSELNFNDNGTLAEPTISCGLLGLSESLDRLDTASSFTSHGLGDMAAPNDMDVHVAMGGSGSSQMNNSGHVTSHLLNNSFGLDVDNTSNLLMQEMLQQASHTSNNPGPGITNSSTSIGDGRPHDVQLGGSSSNQMQAANNGVTAAMTTQWEESLQDLQSLLALHGQPTQMSVSSSAIDPQPTSSSFGVSSLNRGPFSLDKAAGGFLQGKFSGDSELLSLLQFPRSNSSAMQSGGHGHGGPVSAFPSNPGFRKGPVNSCNIIPGLYSSSSLVGAHGQNAASTIFPYASSPSLTSNYFNLNTGSSSGSHLLHGHGSAAMAKGSSQSMMRTSGGSSGIIDLQLDSCEDSGLTLSDHHRGKNSNFSSAGLFFESAKRGGNDGSLLSGKSASEPRGINHFATERQRREYLNEKYQTLRSLVPNPSKADRASIVADAIDYVKELKRTVQELQILVQEKRRKASLKEASHCKRRRLTLLGDSMEVVGTNDLASCSGVDTGHGSSGSLPRSLSSKGGQQQLMSLTEPLSADDSHLRSSWLQRTSQSGTHVDVRIVHDEVTIKLTQRRRKSSLLHVMITLCELQLDLQHANGATIGEHDIYIFNTKVRVRSTSMNFYYYKDPL